MSDWTISSGVAVAQLQATMSFADAGAPAGGASRVQLFTTNKPEPGAAVSDAVQAEIVLATPCGTITNGVWSLTPATPGGALVMATGVPKWARWLSATGAWVADATVTDLTGTGGIRIGGGQTPPGETGPMLYAGGLAVLGSTAFI